MLIYAYAGSRGAWTSGIALSTTVHEQAELFYNNAIKIEIYFHFL